MEIPIIFSIAILVISVVIHEVAHGYAALYMGDVTAKYAGRLTMNPIKHIDPVGSILLPLAFALLPGGVILGWAKPVPYNPYNLRNRRWGELIVAIAGPLSNIAIAIIFGLLIRFSGLLNLPEAVLEISLMIVRINVLLAVFNMMPVPPLDGSKVLFAILPVKYSVKFRQTLEKYGLLLVLLVVFFAWNLIQPIVEFFFKLLTGVQF